MYQVNFADGYYIERNGEGVIDLAVQSEKFANFVCNAINEAEKKEFVEKMKKQYNPHGYILENVKNVSAIAREMSDAGYSKEQIKDAANEARAFWGLFPL
jgi:hypothetical protein